MKTIVISMLALAGSFVLSSCISVKTQKTAPPQVTLTTTEHTTASRPRSTTVETQTTRTY